MIKRIVLISYALLLLVLSLLWWCFIGFPRDIIRDMGRISSIQLESCSGNPTFTISDESQLSRIETALRSHVCPGVRIQIKCPIVMTLTDDSGNTQMIGCTKTSLGTRGKLPKELQTVIQSVF